MASVEIDDVRKSFGNHPVIKGVSVGIEDGEFVILVGPSGCGKSTLLRMLAGLEHISSGEIRIGNRVVNDLPPKERDIAMVFQNYALYPHMTVADNMSFSLMLAGVPKAQIQERVKPAAEILGLSNLLERYPRQLSGGQRQRVAMGRAIVRDPQVFLFDEPLSNLDAKLRVSMRTEIKNLHQRLTTTTVYVTHDQIEAMTLAHRVAILEKGVLQQLDTPAKIYNDPANLFVAQFIGSPPMNVVHGALEGSEFQTRGGKVSVPVSGRIHKAILGARPEDCAVVPPGQGHLAAEIYTVELIGDHTLVTAKAGQDFITVKAPKDFAGNTGESVGITLSKDRLFVFDAATGARVR